VRVALHALQQPQRRAVGAVAGARLALGVTAAQQLPLAARVLLQHTVDVAAD
jgi:hypothetical protein